MAEQKELAAPELSEFAQAQENYITGYIQFADGKALAAFAWASATVAFLVSHDGFVELVRSPALTLEWGVATLAVLVLVAAAATSALVVAPRLWAADLESKTPPPGFVFWRSVVQHRTETAYVEAVRQSGELELARARLANTFHLASICDRKYALLLSSLRLATAGFALSAVWFVFWS